MSIPLVDIFQLDPDSKNGDWLGNSNNVYSSSCANNLNVEPQQLVFTPDTIPMLWIIADDTFGINGEISVQTFINYVGTEIINRGYPLVNMEYYRNKNDALVVKISLANNQIIEYTGVV